MKINMDMVTSQIELKQLQRDESFTALQQVEQTANNLRQRILLLDGALMQLRELEAMPGNSE